MATPTKRQRPRPKPRVVLPPEAAYNHSSFPASTQSKGTPNFGTGGLFLEGKTVFGTGSPAFEGESLFGADSTQVKGGSLFGAGSTQVKGGTLFGAGSTQAKGGTLFGAGSTQAKGGPLSGAGSTQAKDGPLSGAGSTQAKDGSLFGAGSTQAKGFGTGSPAFEREPVFCFGSTPFIGFGTGSTQFKGEPLCGTDSSSPLSQADPSGHPHISIDSGSDSELSTTESCPSLPSPSTSSPLTSTPSLSPFPTRSAITTCEGGNGGHQRSVSAGTISTHRRTERALPDSRAGRSKSQGAVPVRNTNNLGETRGDSGATDVEASLADTPQQLVFTMAYKKERSSQSIAHAVFAKMLKLAFKLSDQQKPEKFNDWGCIYILQDPRYREYVKIGRTEYNPEGRLQQWLKCGHPLNLVGAPEECFIRVPCHTRLEILIQTMLWNERRKFVCRHCTAERKKNIPADEKVSTHGEWFEIDKDQALRLVKLGRDWMRSLPYGEDGELTQDWKNRVTRIRKDIKVFTHTLEQEIEEGRRWEAFLTMPDATRLSRIQQWMWDKRLEPNGRLSPSRFDSLCKHKGPLFIFCVLHYLGIMLSGYCYSSVVPYIVMLATLSSAAFAL